MSKVLVDRELKPCPFCKFEPSADQPDCVYPVTPDRVVWALHCYETGGGCGAQVLGESADDCIERWNRRAQPAEAEGVEIRRVVLDALVSMIAGVTSMIPPTDQPLPDFVQAPVDRAVERITAALAAVTAERDRLLVDLERAHRATNSECQYWAREYERRKEVQAERDQLRAEVEASDWVPLTKATPPDGVPVLRWPGWAAEFSIDEWCNDYGCFLMSIEGGERATHWKPLCAPKAAMAAKEA